MRGEDSFTRFGYEGFAGSPPHARGRLEAVYPLTSEEGITPACAGKTKGDFTGAGSPPHARGRHSYDATTDMRVRITPACAGKTLHGRFVRIHRQDHPRMRGEDSHRVKPKVVQ